MKQTPFATWRENGEPDPHGAHYSGSKDTIAAPAVSDVTVVSRLCCDIMWPTIAKERIRWLSRRLYVLAEDHAAYNEQRATPVHGELTDDQVANAFFLHERPFLQAAKDRITWLSEAVSKLEAA